MSKVTFCGLPGSGKTIKAKELENDGYIRMTLDEEVFKMFGKDPQIPLEPLQQKAKKFMFDQVVDYLSAGKKSNIRLGILERS